MEDSTTHGVECKHNGWDYLECVECNPMHNSKCLDCLYIGELCVYHKYPDGKLEIKRCENNTTSKGLNWHHNGQCCVCKEGDGHGDVDS